MSKVKGYLDILLSDQTLNPDSNPVSYHDLCLQNIDDPGSGEIRVAHYKANYNPHKPAGQPQSHSIQRPLGEEALEHLQREYLDTTQSESHRDRTPSETGHNCFCY